MRRLRVPDPLSRSGQHVAHFAAALPFTEWMPTELTDDTFASIRAWTEGLTNVDEPRTLDLTMPWASELGGEPLDAIYVANMCVTPIVRSVLWGCK